MSRPNNVGYEKTHIVWSMWPEPRPDQFQAARIKSGRIVETSPYFATETEADEWIESHRGFDEDDYQRSRT